MVDALGQHRPAALRPAAGVSLVRAVDGHPPLTGFTVMRMSATVAEIQQNRLDRPAHCAENPPNRQRQGTVAARSECQ